MPTGHGAALCTARGFAAPKALSATLTAAGRECCLNAWLACSTLARKQRPCSVMRESSWREQEARDRRISQLEDDKARLEFDATVAAAEAEAARKEAAAQRRLVKRLQDQAAAAPAHGGAASGAGSTQGQVAELLQKRVRVLEAQNIRLRLQAKSSREEEELAAAEAAAAATGPPEILEDFSNFTPDPPGHKAGARQCQAAAAYHDRPNATLEAAMCGAGHAHSQPCRLSLLLIPLQALWPSSGGLMRARAR